MERQGSRGLGGLVVALLFAAVLSAVPHRAEASPLPSWSFSVLYDFNFCSPCTDVNVPSSGVMVTPGGSLLGAACGGGTDGAGGVYRLSRGGKKWKEEVLSDFTVHDPACPTTANLLLSRSSSSSGVGMPAKTIYYGTTPGDGDLACGTVFEMSQTASGWRMTTIYSFQNDGDGCRPAAGLIEDAKGHLYGTTFADDGTVYELVNNGSGWTLDTLYTFSGDDGSNPRGTLLLDDSGNLYGTTEHGGSESCGTVFELSSASVLSVLHNFCTLPDDADGESPTGGLIMDRTGELYGITTGDFGGEAIPAGTVYKLMPGGAFETLYTFCSLADCADGANPAEESLVMDKSGNLYGTTYFGGSVNLGTVFELTSGGEEIVLHNFVAGGSAYPLASLTMDKAGHLLGTTSSPGSVFELTRH